MKNIIHQALKSNNPEAIKLALQIADHPHNYKNDPVGFCNNILKVNLWHKQKEILNALIKHKKVLVKSANAVGKTYLSACACLWFLMSRNPSITLLSAPTARQVSNITFKEIRGLYHGPGLYDKMPRIQLNADHYIMGVTTQNATSYQGHHCDSLMVVFEEAAAIDPEFWEAAKSCLIGGDSYFLAIFNPTDIMCQAYAEEQSGRWHVIDISAFEHPNIIAELKGEEAPYPSAIRMKQLEEGIEEWCEPTDNPTSDDFQWKGKWYKAGPIADARLLGRWPKQSDLGIFSESDWINAFSRVIPIDLPTNKTVIGCDVARFGADYTAIHVRRGPKSLFHESYNGRDTNYTAQRIKKVAEQFCPENARNIKVFIDDCGIGGACVDQANGYNFIPINNGNSAFNYRDYPNKRSENYFLLADKFKRNQISLLELPQNIKVELKRQAINILWNINAKSRRVAERTEDIKKRIGRSPDDLAAMVLAYLDEDDKFRLR